MAGTDPLILVSRADDHLVVSLAGQWVLGKLDRLPEGLAQDIGDESVVLDGKDIQTIDPSGAYRLLVSLRKAGVDLERMETRNFDASVLQVLKLVQANLQLQAQESTEPEKGLLYQTGRVAVEAASHVSAFTGFVGQLASEAIRLLVRPAGFRAKEFVAQIEAIFVHAIPISALMIFLLGVVFAYLMGVQAQKFGANIFVVDGVAAAVLRELSPVIVAILVAGRTGAAITAQLGTMKVNEEIDALSVLGLSPMAVLVLPRILALVIALPLLVFIGDVAGLLGGMVVAKTQLGLEYSQFLERLDSVVKMKTLLVGMGKAPVFAIFIGLIACRMGMNVERDARSVGLHTTSTVVQSIVAVIVLNAIFAIAFTELGI